VRWKLTRRIWDLIVRLSWQFRGTLISDPNSGDSFLDALETRRNGTRAGHPRCGSVRGAGNSVNRPDSRVLS